MLDCCAGILLLRDSARVAARPAFGLTELIIRRLLLKSCRTMMLLLGYHLVIAVMGVGARHPRPLRRQAVREANQGIGCCGGGGWRRAAHKYTLDPPRPGRARRHRTTVQVAITAAAVRDAVGVLRLLLGGGSPGRQCSRCRPLHLPTSQHLLPMSLDVVVLDDVAVAAHCCRLATVPLFFAPLLTAACLYQLARRVGCGCPHLLSLKLQMTLLCAQNLDI